MIKNYTQDAKQRCLSLIDADVEDIWNDIETVPEDTDADKWKKKLRTIADEYVLSSRFALMRIFLAAPGAQLLDSNDPERGFITVLSDGSVCRVENITAEHARQMTKEELDSLEHLLADRVATQSGHGQERDPLLIKKALFPVQKKTTLLTSKEALELGHALQLTLTDMEWFLLRVLDVEDGFSYNTSNDLIEAYGFLTKISSDEVDVIKAAYKERYGGVRKLVCDDKEEDWTRDAGGSLPEKVQEWSAYNVDNRNEAFLEWLGQKAAYLDLPSQKALRIYRNLAVYTYNLAIREEAPPDVDKKPKLRENGKKETDFLCCVREITQDEDYADATVEKLFDNGCISLAKCKSVADTLLLENLNFTFSNQKDKTKAWHVIQVMTDGRMTISGGVNASRTRVRDILAGEIERIEKSDLLYLLWFLSNLCWFDGKDHLKSADIKSRLSDFIDAAELCLNEAGLPGFYPPHLIEQSMMLSTISAFAGTEKCDPAETYESVCSSLIIPKAKAPKPKKIK